MAPQQQRLLLHIPYVQSNMHVNRTASSTSSGRTRGLPSRSSQTRPKPRWPALRRLGFGYGTERERERERTSCLVLLYALLSESPIHRIWSMYIDYDGGRVSGSKSMAAWGHRWYTRSPAYCTGPLTGPPLRGIHLRIAAEFRSVLQSPPQRSRPKSGNVCASSEI